MACQAFVYSFQALQHLRCILGQSLLKRFSSNLHLFNDIGVSIDFPNDLHSEFRGRKKSFAMAKDTLGELVSRGVKTELVTCIMAPNVHFLPEIYNLAESLGVDMWRLNRFHASRNDLQRFKDIPKSSNGVCYVRSDLVCTPEQMLKLAKETFPEGTFQIQDAENLTVQSNSQDAVVCLEALVHYPNPERAIGEFHRVLKKGGILVIDSDNTYSLRRLVKRAYQFYNHHKKQFGEDIFRPYSGNEFRTMLTDAGFSIEIFKYLGVLSPISLRGSDGRTINLVNGQTAMALHQLKFDNLPLVKRLATYHLVLARK